MNPFGHKAKLHTFLEHDIHQHVHAFSLKGFGTIMLSIGHKDNEKSNNAETSKHHCNRNIYD